jgi:hypothetical protein
MDRIIFYKEWLSLPKEEFRILALTAAGGGQYSGTYTDMCNSLSVTPQSRNRNKIKSALEGLAAGQYVDWQSNGNTQNITVIPKEGKIKIPVDLLNSIMRHEYSSEDVAWEQVIKTFLWIYQNKEAIVTNQMIAADLGISESTVCNAKNVLEHEYDVIKKRIISTKTTLENGEEIIITLGQELIASAWWNGFP